MSDFIDRSTVAHSKMQLYRTLSKNQVKAFDNFLEILQMDTAQGMTTLEMPNDIYTFVNLQGITKLCDVLRIDLKNLLMALEIDSDITKALKVNEETGDLEPIPEVWSKK